MGSVYSRKRSTYLWIKYHQHGRAIRESTGPKNEVVAAPDAARREGDVERGIPIDPKVGRITFDEAAEDMLNDYKVNRKRTYDRCEAPDRKAPGAVLRQSADDHRSPRPTLRAYVAKRLADGTPVRHRQRGSEARREASGTDVPKAGRCQPARSIASSRC